MSKKTNRLQALSQALTQIDHQLGCAFNFHYLDKSQPETITEENYKTLVDGLKRLSGNGLSYWSNQTIAGSKKHKNRTFKKLSGFNFSQSNFTEPTNIPADIEWAEFYLGATFRVVGFTEKINAMPDALDVFYVVFIDPNHDFYAMKKG